VLFRIFVFIPCQAYRLLYPFSIVELQSIWVAGAAETPIKVAMSIIVTAIVVPPLIKVLKKTGLI